MHRSEAKRNTVSSRRVEFIPELAVVPLRRENSIGRWIDSFSLWVVRVVRLHMLARSASCATSVKAYQFMYKYCILDKTYDYDSEP